MPTQYLPRKEADLGQWTSAFAGQVADLFASIGISSGQSAALTAANNIWVAALAASTAEATRSKPTLAAKNTAKTNVLAIVRQLVGIIQKYPGTTDEMRATLGITIPKHPAPAGAPDTPTNVKATLSTTGNIDLTWKNKNATGCVYMIWRQIDGTGAFVSLGGAGTKKFTDTEVPVGVTQLEYQIQAVRSTGTSGFAILNVKFGNDSSSLTITEKAPLKAAA